MTVQNSSLPANQAKAVTFLFGFNGDTVRFVLSVFVTGQRQQMSFTRFATVVRMLGLIGLANFEEPNVASIPSIGFERRQQARRNAATDLRFALDHGIDHADVGQILLSEFLEQPVFDERVGEVLVESSAAGEAVLEVSNESSSLITRGRCDFEEQRLLVDIAVAMQATDLFDEILLDRDVLARSKARNDDAESVLPRIP